LTTLAEAAGTYPNASETLSPALPILLHSIQGGQSDSRSYCFLTSRVIGFWGYSCAGTLPCFSDKSMRSGMFCLMFWHAQSSNPPSKASLACRHLGTCPSLCIRYRSSVSTETYCKHLQIRNCIYGKLEMQTLYQPDAEIPWNWERCHCWKVDKVKCFLSKTQDLISADEGCLTHSLFFALESWCVLFSSPTPKPLLYLLFPFCVCRNKHMFWSTKCPKVLQETFQILREWYKN